MPVAPLAPHHRRSSEALKLPVDLRRQNATELIFGLWPPASQEMHHSEV